nr:hypothetical protein [Planococcus glaciei]
MKIWEAVRFTTSKNTALATNRSCRKSLLQVPTLCLSAATSCLADRRPASSREKKELIDRLKKHQLARVLRVDKLTFAALEETLKAYVIGEAAAMELPTVRDVIRTPEEIRLQAEAFIAEMEAKTSAYRLYLKESTSQVGGGTMPGVELPTFMAAVSHIQLSAQELAAKLRDCRPAIISPDSGRTGLPRLPYHRRAGTGGDGGGVYGD